MREAHVCAISSHIQSLKQLAKGKDGKNYLQTIYTDDAQIYICPLLLHHSLFNILNITCSIFTNRPSKYSIEDTSNTHMYFIEYL